MRFGVFRTCSETSMRRRQREKKTKKKIQRTNIQTTTRTPAGACVGARSCWISKVGLSPLGESCTGPAPRAARRSRGGHQSIVGSEHVTKKFVGGRRTPTTLCAFHEAAVAASPVVCLIIWGMLLLCAGIDVFRGGGFGRPIFFFFFFFFFFLWWVLLCRIIISPVADRGGEGDIGRWTVGKGQWCG